MVVKRKYRKGVCKACGKVFRRDNAGELIKAIHTHYVKAHSTTLSRKIKKGMKKRQQESGNNPAWLTALLTGIFPPANIPMIKSQYKKMTPEERTAAKAMVTGLTMPLGGQASAVASAILRALDIMVEEE